MNQTKHRIGYLCISQLKQHTHKHSQQRSPTIWFVCLVITILSIINGTNSETLPVKSFQAFSPQTIAQLSHKSPVSLFSQNINNNGQKESELAMNPIEIYPKQNAFEMSMSYPLEELAVKSDSENIELDNDDDNDEIAQLQELVKRASSKWQGFQGGWGKRAPNNWNKLSAAWGKRRIPSNAAWNNLSGMWGKKRAKWNELSGMWGKRAAWRDMSGGWGKKKRSNAPHWNKLRGMWGKRSTPIFDETENQQQLLSEGQQAIMQQIEPMQQQQLFPSAFSIPQSNIKSNNKKDH